MSRQTSDNVGVGVGSVQADRLPSKQTRKQQFLRKFGLIMLLFSVSYVRRVLSHNSLDHRYHGVDSEFRR